MIVLLERVNMYALLDTDINKRTMFLTSLAHDRFFYLLEITIMDDIVELGAYADIEAIKETFPELFI